MILNESKEELLSNLLDSEAIKRVFDAAKVGVEADNLVIVDTFLQNILTQVFLELPKLVTLEPSDFKETGPKTDSIKKFMDGADKRFGVGLDLACNYICKSRRLWFMVSSLSINENANCVKFFENKDLEFVPTADVVSTYNELLTQLNKALQTEKLNEIKL